MLIAFLIMLREGLEAALIVGIVASYLAKTGQRQWLPSVWAGVVLAAVLCLVLGVGLDLASAEFPQKQQELFEGVVAVIAVAVLTSMVFWMRRAAKSIKRELHDNIDAALARSSNGDGSRAAWPLVGMVFLAVAREGLESVFFLLATFQQGEGWSMPAGALLGLLCAVAVGALIYRGGVRLDLARFFRWTSVFIIFVAAGLAAGALRAFHEAGLWNGLQQVVVDLSNVMPTDSPAGAILAGLLGYSDTPTVGEVIVYFLYLVPVLLLFTNAPRQPTAVSHA